jgi:hypothetical protein
MVGPVKVLVDRFFIFALLSLRIGGLLRMVKTTSDVEFDATVDQTDMRGLVTARPDPSGPSSV